MSSASWTPGNWIGDNGYIGSDMITSFNKLAGRVVLGWLAAFNGGISEICYVGARVIATVKTWRVPHADCRRAVATFATTISAVAGLQFCRLGCEETSLAGCGA
jgi:hypothetical protein